MVRGFTTDYGDDNEDEDDQGEVGWAGPAEASSSGRSNSKRQAARGEEGPPRLSFSVPSVAPPKSLKIGIRPNGEGGTDTPVDDDGMPLPSLGPVKPGALTPEQKKRMEELVPVETKHLLENLRRSREHTLDTSQYVDENENLWGDDDDDEFRIQVEDGPSFKRMSTKDRALTRRVVLFLCTILEERVALPPELRRDAYGEDKSTLAVSCATFDKPLMRTLAKFTDDDQKVRQQRKEFQDAERKLAKIRLDMNHVLPEGLTEVEQRMTKKKAERQFKQVARQRLHKGAGGREEVDEVVKEVIHEYRSKAVDDGDDGQMLARKIERETDELRRLQSRVRGQVAKDIAQAKAHSNSIVRYLGMLAERNAGAASPLMTTTFIVRRLPIGVLQALAHFMSDMNEMTLVLFSRVVREAMGETVNQAYAYADKVPEQSDAGSPARVHGSPARSHGSPASRGDPDSPKPSMARRQMSRIEVAQRDVNMKHRPGLETIKHIRDAHNMSFRSPRLRPPSQAASSRPTTSMSVDSNRAMMHSSMSIAFEPMSLKAAGSARFTGMSKKSYKPYRKLVDEFYSSKQKKAREKMAENDELAEKYQMVVQEPVKLRRPRTSAAVLDRKEKIAQARMYEVMCTKFGETKMGGGKAHLRSSHRQWTSSSNVFKTAANVSEMAMVTKAENDKHASSRGRYVTNRDAENPNCMCLTCWQPLGDGCDCEKPFISRFERTGGFWVNALHGRMRGMKGPIKPFVVTPSREEEEALQPVTERLEYAARMTGRRYETVPVVICSRCWFVVGSECECTPEECVPISLDPAYRAAPAGAANEAQRMQSVARGAGKGSPDPPGDAAAKRSMSIAAGKGWGKAGKTAQEETGLQHKKKIGRIVQENPRICTLCWSVLGMGCMCARPKLFYSTDLVQAVVQRRAALRKEEARRRAMWELEQLESQAVETDQYEDFNKFLRQRRTSAAVSNMDNAALCRWLETSGFGYLTETVAEKGLTGKELDGAFESELVDLLDVDEMLAYRLRVALDIAAGEDVVRDIQGREDVVDRHLQGFYDAGLVEYISEQSLTPEQSGSSMTSNSRWGRMKSVGGGGRRSPGIAAGELGKVARAMGRVGMEQKAFHSMAAERPTDIMIAKVASGAAHRVLSDQSKDPTSKYKAKLFDHSVHTIHGDGRYHWNPPEKDARMRLVRGDRKPKEPEPEVEDLLPPEWEAGMMRIYTQLTHESEHNLGIKKLRSYIRKFWDEIHEAFSKFCRIPCFGEIPVDDGATGFYWPHDKDPKVMYVEQLSRFLIQTSMLSNKVCQSFLQRKYLPELEAPKRDPFWVELDAKGKPIKDAKAKQRSAKEQMMVELAATHRYCHGTAFGVHDVVQFAETLIRARHYTVISGKGIKTKGDTVGKDAELWKQFDDAMNQTIKTVLSPEFDIPLHHRLYYSSLVQSILAEYEVPLWAMFRQFAQFDYEMVDGKVTWTSFSGAAGAGKVRCFDTMCVNELVTIAKAMEMVNADINIDIFFRIVKEVMGCEKLFAGTHPSNQTVDLSFSEFKQILVHNTGLRFKKAWKDQKGIKDSLIKVCEEFKAWGSRNLPYKV